MVFDFLKKILGEKKEEVDLPMEMTLALTEIDGFVEENLSEEAKDPIEWMARAEQSKKEALEYIQELEDFQFKKDQLEKMKMQPFYNQVLKTKPIYISKLREILGNIKEYDDIEEFKRNLSRVLKLIQRTQLNQGKKLVASFERFMININTPLNKLLLLNQEINDSLETQSKNIKLREEIKTLKNDLESGINAPDLQEKIKIEIEEKIKKIDSRIHELNKEISDTENGEEYKKFQGLKNELEEKEGALRALNLSTEISMDPYKRCFRKFNKLIKDKKASGDRNTAEKLLKDNVKAFEEFGCEPVGKILLEIERLITDGSIKLKKKEKERTLASIKEYDPEKISDIILKIASTRKEVEDLKERISSMDMDEKIRGIRDRIKELEKEKDRYLAELLSVDRLVKKKSEDISNKKDELSSLLTEIHGAKVEVVLEQQR